MLFRKPLNLIAVLSLVFQAPAFAQWGEASKTRLEKLSQSVSQYRDDPAMAIQAAIRFAVHAKPLEAHFSRVSFDSPAFTNASKDYPPYFFVAQGTPGADVVAIFPGIFGSPEDPGMVKIAKSLNAAGSSVILLPNPWSGQYLVNWPQARSGNMAEEAKVMASMVASAVRVLGGEAAIGKIKLFGESYGGYLSLMTAAELVRGPLASHVDSVLSVSLPFDMAKAMKSLDRMTDEQEANYFDEGCILKTQHFFPKVGLAWSVFLGGKIGSISYQGKSCSDAIFVFGGFHASLAEVVKLMNVRRRAKHLPEFNFSEARKIRFQLIQDQDIDLAPIAVELYDTVKFLRLNTVVMKALVAQNDLVSEGQQETSPFTSEELYRLPRGGHLGFRGDPNYFKLVQEELK